MPRSLSALLCLCLLVLLCSCAAPPPEPPPVAPPVLPPAPVEPPVEPAEKRVSVDWIDIPGWYQNDHRPALAAFRVGCKALKNRAGWGEICDAAATVPDDPISARLFYEQYFSPYQLQNEDGSREGTITGYYGPELEGREQPSKSFAYPIYGWPDDMLVIDLSLVYPELGRYRLRGRKVGRRILPYWTRAEIDANPGLLSGKELFWFEDPVELFFLHIQGSGRVALPNGEKVMVGYENQNGHPYRSIGKLLIERGFMTRDQMSMQNIRAWARKNPDLVWDLLAENPSYVFFHQLSPEFITPPGSLGVALTPERSLAVDTRYVPLGAPIYLSTLRPDNDEPLEQLMVAQDTGGAIKGRVRADFFWGMGDAAGALAGRMKHDGKLWVLLPKEGD